MLKRISNEESQSAHPTKKFKATKESDDSDSECLFRCDAFIAENHIFPNDIACIISEYAALCHDDEYQRNGELPSCPHCFDCCDCGGDAIFQCVCGHWCCLGCAITCEQCCAPRCSAMCFRGCETCPDTLPGDIPFCAKCREEDSIAVCIICEEFGCEKCLEACPRCGPFFLAHAEGCKDNHTRTCEPWQ